MEPLCVGSLAVNELELEFDKKKNKNKFCLLGVNFLNIFEVFSFVFCEAILVFVRVLVLNNISCK